MSEPMFPGQPAPAQGEPTAAAPEGSNRKALLAVGGIVGAVLLAGGAFVLMNSGSGSTDASAPVVPPAPSVSAPSAPAAAPSAAAIKVTKVSVTSRDPFAPLYPTPAATAAAAPAASQPAPVVTQAPAVTVELASVNLSSQKAALKIDGKAYTAAVGQGFGTNYMLYSIFNAQCAGVLYGDQSVAVCMGKPMTVQP